MDDIIEKALGYILMITGIVAIAVIISSRKPAKKRKRKKR